MRGDRDLLRELLRLGADVNAAQGDGMTALHWAAERGDRDAAEMLLVAGANPEAVTRIGKYTPLHLASKSGSASIVARLIDAGGDVQATTSNTGVTPLHLAAASGGAEAVELLLDHGADPDARESEWGQTPLTFAAANNRPGTIQVLLAYGADSELTSKVLDYEAQAALERLAGRHETEVLRALTGGEGRPTPAQMQTAVRAGRAVYLEASQRGEDETPEESPETRGFRNPYLPLVYKIGGLTPLLHAARQGHIDAIRAFLDGGAEVDGVSAADGTTALLIATLNGQFDVALLLIERGADPNLASDLNGATPLWGALNSKWQPRTRYPQPQERAQQEASYLDVMAALLESSADPDARMTKRPWYMIHGGCGNLNCGLVDPSGSTAFFRAAYATDVDAMRLLIGHGAAPDIPTTAPPEPQRVRLDDFVERQVIEEARDRLEADSFSELPDSTQFAALRDVREELPESARDEFSDDVFAESPHSIRLELLAAVDHQDSVRASAPDPSGLPRVPPGGAGVWPIHAASGAGYGEGFAGNAHRHAPDGWLPAVKYLVEVLGADVNARDPKGYTPLHHAAARGDNELILYLVAMGADVTAISRFGETTADMANGPVQRLSPIPETIALLERLGSKNNHNCYGC